MKRGWMVRVLEILNLLAVAGVGALGGFGIGYFFLLSLAACVLGAVIGASLLGGFYAYAEHKEAHSILKPHNPM